MSLSPLVFTGVSTFSTDFQTVLDRASKIGSLPITALQNQQKDLVQQKLVLTNLSTAAGTLATAISALGDVGDNKALSASSSDTSKVTATNTGSSSAAVYTISDITSVAHAAAETSTSGYASSTTTPVSTTGTLDLVVGSSHYSLDVSGNNSLTGARDAINNQHAGVTATILTTGTGDDPFYLSITDDTTGATTLKLVDDPTGAATNLITANNQGADTEFKLNGVPVKKNSTLINDVVPGTVFNILGTTTGDATVSVTIASDPSKLAAALQSFVSSYNALRDQVDGQVGKNAGQLSGDFIVGELQSRLRAITSYSGTSGSIKSLSDLGIEFDTNGVASLNQTTFGNLSSTQINDAFGFLGSSSTGFGALASKLTDISDNTTGLAKIQLDKYGETDKRLSDQVAALTDRLSLSQSTLQAKLQAADALLASLQSQQSIVTASIDSLNAAIYGTSNNK